MRKVKPEQEENKGDKLAERNKQAKLILATRVENKKRTCEK